MRSHSYFINLNVFLFIVLASLQLADAEPNENKDHYTLFNPTPREAMREMSTDRPDTTESPYTVDAGHVQLEMSFLEISHDAEKGERTRSYDVSPMNLKLGLTNSTDLQFVFSPYVREISSNAEGTERIEGFGDETLLRLKQNIYGNDEGSSAFGIMPFIKFPTGNGALSNDHTEGGLIAVYSHDLNEDLSLGLMLEGDAVYNEERDSYGDEYVHTATIGYPIAGNFGGYLEYVGVLPQRSGTGYQAKASGGVNYSVSDEMVFDAGTRIGLSQSAEDQVWFIGLSVRR